jgi:DNA-binding beta-propeller fold protein YncE
VATLALALATVTFIGLWWGFRPPPSDRSGEDAAQEPVDLDPRVTAVVPVGPYPADVAVGEGAVWVSVPEQQPEQNNLIVRIDPVTNEVVARIPVKGYVEELAAGAGGVWGVGIRGTGASNLSFSVERIDPATNEVVAQIQDVSGPLAIGEGALWAVDRAGARAGPEGSSLLRINPATNQVVATIPLGVAAWDIEFGEGYLWVLPLEPSPGEGDILQVDPTMNEVVASIEIPLSDTGYPPTVYSPALGESSAWVPACCPDNELMVVRVDVGTSGVVGEPIRLPGGAPFAVAAGHVWFIEERGALYGLNLDTLEVDQSVSGFDWPAGGFPDPSTELDLGQLAVWVTNSDQNSVTRIDLAAPGTPPPAPMATQAPPEGRLLLQVSDRVEVLDRDGRLQVLGDDLIALGLAPDGSLALVSTKPTSDNVGAELLTIDLASGERSAIAMTDAVPYPARLSPNGSMIAYRAGYVLCLVEAQGAAPICMPDLGRVYTFDWAPDSQRLVLGLPPPEPLTVLDVVSGQVTPLVPSDDERVLSALEQVGFGRATRVQFESPRWSSSGRYIATLAMVFETVGGREGNVVLVFDTAGNLVAQGKPMGEYSDARSWSPTTDVFAYGWGGAPYDIVEARVLDPATGEDQVIFSTEDVARETVRDLAWSPSGRWVAILTAPSEESTYALRVSFVDSATLETARAIEFPNVTLADWGA